MRVGILTGGGDVPGLNACIKVLVNLLIEGGNETIGFRRGWAGLLFCQPGNKDSIDEWTMELDPRAVRKIDRSGGTILHTSRTNPASIMPEDLPEFLQDKVEGDGPQDFTEYTISVLEGMGIDALIAIGGDDTLSYGLRLHEEGVPIVAIPKTMDNDVWGTEYCIGFSTAVTRTVNLIHNLRTSAASHERLGVVELFGRNSGQTSLVAAYLAGVDRAIISEVPFDPEKLARLLVQDKKTNPSNYAMMTISEGAKPLGGEIVQGGTEDAFGHKKLGGIGLVTGEMLQELTGEHIIYQQLAYLMRSGNPDSLDLMVANNYASIAADLVAHRKFGRMMALRNGVYTTVPLSVVGKGARKVDVEELYDVEQYRPKVPHMLGKPMFLY